MGALDQYRLPRTSRRKIVTAPHALRTIADPFRREDRSAYVHVVGPDVAVLQVVGVLPGVCRPIASSYCESFATT
ncbi:hypothetical protein GCM10009555_063730 [Acrocarpospora macrocephala]|uniref:Uncharacterized protein n=1 Tax=Acrocarpospora macrocephala TaxID=150177 RepID=A0A5M3WHT4_9ACTN|nr:hypothetical protein Amac_012870 [Acrocarpospora macrocephala]